MPALSSVEATHIFDTCLGGLAAIEACNMRSDAKSVPMDTSSTPNARRAAALAKMMVKSGSLEHDARPPGAWPLFGKGEAGTSAGLLKKLRADGIR